MNGHIIDMRSWVLGGGGGGLCSVLGKVLAMCMSL